MYAPNGDSFLDGVAWYVGGNFTNFPPTPTDPLLLEPVTIPPDLNHSISDLDFELDSPPLVKKAAIQPTMAGDQSTDPVQHVNNLVEGLEANDALDHFLQQPNSSSDLLSPSQGAIACTVLPSPLVNPASLPAMPFTIHSNHYLLTNQMMLPAAVNIYAVGALQQLQAAAAFGGSGLPLNSLATLQSQPWPRVPIQISTNTLQTPVARENSTAAGESSGEMSEETTRGGRGRRKLTTEEKKRKNCEAANRHREKRRREAEKMEEEHKLLMRENNDLKERVAELERELEATKDEVRMRLQNQ